MIMLEYSSDPILISIIILLPGNPERLQNIIANQRIDIEGCIILIKWDPPTNLGAGDVAYYSVQVNETSINETSTQTAYHVCTCGSYHCIPFLSNCLWYSIAPTTIICKCS